MKLFANGLIPLVLAFKMYQEGPEPQKFCGASCPRLNRHGSYPGKHLLAPPVSPGLLFPAPRGFLTQTRTHPIPSLRQRGGGRGSAISALSLCRPLLLGTFAFRSNHRRLCLLGTPCCNLGILSRQEPGQSWGSPHCLPVPRGPVLHGPKASVFRAIIPYIFPVSWSGS